MRGVLFLLLLPVGADTGPQGDLGSTFILGDIPGATHAGAAMKPAVFDDATKGAKALGTLDDAAKGGKALESLDDATKGDKELGSLDDATKESLDDATNGGKAPNGRGDEEGKTGEPQHKEKAVHSDKLPLDEEDAPLYQHMFDGSTEIPVTFSLDMEGENSNEKGLPYLVSGFDEFSEVLLAFTPQVSSKDPSKEETVPSLLECPDSITRVDSPKRSMRDMPEVDADDTSPKRAKVDSPKRALRGMTDVDGDDNATKRAKIEDIVIASPIERSLASAIRRGLSSLRNREASISKREATMNKRESSMDKREASMDKREASMDKREASIFDVNKSGSEPDAKSTSDDKSTADSRENTNTTKVDKVKDSLAKKIESAKSMVEKADNTATVIEKVINIPTRTGEITELCKTNKCKALNFVKGLVGSATSAGIMGALKQAVGSELFGHEVTDTVAGEEVDGEAGASKVESEAAAGASKVESEAAAGASKVESEAAAGASKVESEAAAGAKVEPEAASAKVE